MQNCIEINSLSKNFENIVALDNINLSIKKGDIVALLGADGSGKTTLLRALIGLICPDKGKITTLGFNPISDKELIILNIGYMPQKFWFVRGFICYRKP